MCEDEGKIALAVNAVKKPNAQAQIQ